MRAAFSVRRTGARRGRSAVLRRRRAPQYYNEIVCDPHDVDRVYLLETFVRHTEDGGKTFQRLGGRDRHVDDHALWIDDEDTDHLIIGGDGGLYETWESRRGLGLQGESPDHAILSPGNRRCLTLLQRLRRNAGQQTHWGGPTRTRSPAGIANEDWFVTVGGDGFQKPRGSQRSEHRLQ